MSFTTVAGLIVASALASLAMAAGAAPGSGPPKHAAGGADTTPPAAFVRARGRQELHRVLRRGIQTTCGTEDRERPVTCSILAWRKGRIIARDTAGIERPFNRYHFNLRLPDAETKKLRRARLPIEIRLVLRVRDEAGNVGIARKRIRLVRDRS